MSCLYNNNIYLQYTTTISLGRRLWPEGGTDVRCVCVRADKTERCGGTGRSGPEFRGSV